MGYEILLRALGLQRKGNLKSLTFLIYVFYCFRVQKENDNLVGKHSIHSQQLQSENINFPSDVNVCCTFLHSR